MKLSLYCVHLYGFYYLQTLTSNLKIELVARILSGHWIRVKGGGISVSVVFGGPM